MTREDRKLHKQFHRILEQAIRSLYRRIRKPIDLDGVWAEMETAHSYTLAQMRPNFGEQYMRVLVQHRLKRTVMSAKEQDRAEAQAAQTELDFEDIEQFRGAPRGISYEDRPGHVVYVPFEDSHCEQRRLSLVLLDKNIGQDMVRREAQVAATKFADSLAKIFGDLPPRELIRLWRKRGGVGSAGGEA